MLLHNEVRWSSKGACSTRFYAVFKSVLKFPENRDGNLKIKLKNFKADIAYLTDLSKNLMSLTYNYKRTV